MKGFWYLLEDFFDQSWAMKAFLGWGWLCIVIMLGSIYASVQGLMGA